MTAQAEFDKKYITSPELRRVLGVTPATILNGYRSGRLPPPVRVPGCGGGTQLMLWVRCEVQPYVDRWLAARAA